MNVPRDPKSILIIQTAFLGDVILATALIEKLYDYFPRSKIDFLLRKGNESILANNPKIRRVLIWDKGSGKYSHLFQLLTAIRKEKYDIVINVQRFAASGFLAGFSGAKEIIGFDKNPFSFLFTKKVMHSYEGHEVQRNQKLIEHITSPDFSKPVLYPSDQDQKTTAAFTTGSYICIAPASVWFTKQFPKEKWMEMIRRLPANKKILLLGAKQDALLCDAMIEDAKGLSAEMINLAGKLSIMETAAVMKQSAMNFVNDSAPLHIASAVNAPVTAVFCSTIPQFGFGPLSDKSFIVETKEKLTCRPCGIHGRNACPEGHFRCAYGIEVKELTDKIT